VTAPAPIESWIPELFGLSLCEVGELDEAALGPAVASMLARVDRPLATIAGSNGS
jgi:hypothetical protein